MRLLRSKKLLWALIILTVFLSLGLIKTLASFSLERYLSNLLETPVTIKSLQLSPLELHGTIKDEDNLAYVKVNKLYPLEVDFTYDGNADAFEVYQPIKGQGKLKGQLFYKDLLRVEGDIFVLGSKAQVEVNEQVQGWEVRSQISHLELSQLIKENDIKVPASGSINADININTAKDSYIQMYTDEIKIKTESFEDVNLTMSFEDDDIDLKGKFLAPNFEYKDLSFHYDQNSSLFEGRFELLYKKTKRDIVFELEGEHKKSSLAIQADASIGNSHIITKDFEYDMKTHDFSSHLDISLVSLQDYTYLLKAFDIDLKGDFEAKAEIIFKDKQYEGNLFTQSFGGETRLRYKNEGFGLRAKEFDLAKLLRLLNKDPMLEGKLDLEAGYKKQDLKLNLKSKKLKLYDEGFSNIELNVNGERNELHGGIRLKNEYVQIHSSEITIKGLKEFNLEANASTPYTSDFLMLEGKGLYDEDHTRGWLNAKSPEIFFSIPKLEYKKEKLRGRYLSTIEGKLSGLSKPINLKGEFSYANALYIKGSNKDLGGDIHYKYDDGKVGLKAEQISSLQVQKYLHQPVYVNGDFDLSAKGSIDTLSLQLDAQNLHLNKAETGLDENLSVSITSDIDAKEIKLKAKIKNRLLAMDNASMNYNLIDKDLLVIAPLVMKIKDVKKDLLLRLNADFSEQIRANAQLSHKWDNLKLSNISYKNEALKTDIELDIKDMNIYKNLHKYELFGPLVFRGKGSYINKSPHLDLDSSSLGGNLNLRLDNQDIEVQLEKLLAVEIGRFYKGKASTSSGELSGNMQYNLETGKGNTDLSAYKVEVNGIDLDKQLQTINDMLSLNIYAMGKTLINKRYSKNDDINLSTKIKHMTFSVDITPDEIISKDIALATEKSRFSVDTNLKYNGDIQSFEIFILDYQGCALVSQKLSGNITSPKLVDTKVASVILGRIPGNLMDAGGKLIGAGAGFLDSTSSFIWKRAFRQDSNLTYVQDGLSKGVNIFSSGRSMVVSKECKVVYHGGVNAPVNPTDFKEPKDE